MAETAVFLRDQNKIRSPRLFNDYSDTVGGLISAQLTLFCPIIISSLFIVYIVKHPLDNFDLNKYYQASYSIW